MLSQPNFDNTRNHDNVAGGMAGRHLAVEHGFNHVIRVETGRPTYNRSSLSNLQKDAVIAWLLREVPPVPQYIFLTVSI